MALPVGAPKRAKLVGGLLISGGMYGAELTGVSGGLRKRVRTSVARAISGKAPDARRCLAGGHLCNSRKATCPGKRCPR
eukprot:1499528-Heterocapsa_arctica.AAC.1